MSEAPHVDKVHYDMDAPIMDREQIDMLIMGDEGDPDQSLAQELFELFANESAEKLNELEEVCAQNEVIRLRNIVHFVAGSAGNLGLARLAAFYRGIEHAIDGGELTDVSGLEAPVCEEFEIAREAFRADFNL